MKYRINNETLIVWLYILSAMMLTGQFLEINILTSISFALSFIVVFIAWLLHLSECSSLDILTIIIMATSLICVILTGRDLSIDYFNNWLMFSSVFLFFSLCIKMQISIRTAKKIFKINLFVSFVCLFAYVFLNEKAFYVSNIGVKYLKFGFYNPNSLALFLLSLVFSGICFFSVYFERKYRLLKFIYIAIFSILISQTLSRTALLALFLFLGIYVIFKRTNRYYLPQGKLFNWLIAIFPLVFVFLYMIFVDKLGSSNILAFLISEGKGIDSRQEVWGYAFYLFTKSPLWGTYGEMMTSALYTQMHNSHLNVLVSYGFVVFLLFVLFLYIVLSYICKTSRENRTELSAWAFIICLILGSGEAVLFSGGLSFYLLVGQFLLLCNLNKANEVS